MDFKESGIEAKTSANLSFFAPVYTPGVVQKEIIDDNGLNEAKGYLNNLNLHDEVKTLSDLKEKYGSDMIDEMVSSIRKIYPHATDCELALTICAHI